MNNIHTKSRLGMREFSFMHRLVMCPIVVTETHGPLMSVAMVGTDGQHNFIYGIVYGIN